MKLLKIPREVQILLVIVFFGGITYYGVEPLAHKIFYPKVAPVDYEFKDLEIVGAGLNPNLENGKEIVLGTCSACHSINVLGVENASGDAKAVSESFGVNPPDLSNVGVLYSEHFLKAFIKDPVKASKLLDKFNGIGEDNEDKKVYPMSPAVDLGLDDQGIVDVVAYLKTIAKSELSNEEVFIESCARCHSLDYGNILMSSLEGPLTDYMGKYPPDLSQMIRSKGEAYLNTFINDPQKHIKGTSMPRVGLNKKSQEQVIAYMEEKGDSSKAMREDLGIKVLLYLLVFTIFAYLFKRQVWKNLH